MWINKEAKKPRKKPDNIESMHQRCFFQKLNILYQSGLLTEAERKLTFAVPNGGKRDVVTARNLKLEGVSAGVPDIFCDIAREDYHGLRIELKKPIVEGIPKPKITSEQKEKISLYIQEGYLAMVCFGYQEALQVYLNYLGKE